MRRSRIQRTGPPVRWWENLLVRAVLAPGNSPRGRSGYGRARGLLRLFRLAEWLMERRHPPCRVRPGGVVRYQIAPLPCADLPLPAQPPVRRGEPVIILHFDNHAIAALAAHVQGMPAMTARMFRVARIDLARLATLTGSGAIPAGARAVWAETVLYPALGRLGFATRPAPRTLRTPFARLFMLAMLSIYGDNAHGARELDRLRLGEAWMALDEFQRRFAPGVLAEHDNQAVK